MVTVMEWQLSWRWNCNWEDAFIASLAVLSRVDKPAKPASASALATLDEGFFMVGDTAFTAPRFDGFMRRIMPGDRWRT